MEKIYKEKINYHHLGIHALQSREPYLRFFFLSIFSSDIFFYFKENGSCEGKSPRIRGVCVF